MLLPVSLSIEPADTNNTHTSPDWGSDWMASNMPGTCYIQLYRMKGRCVSKWNPLRFTSQLQKELLLFMQAAVCLSTWMSVDSMYAEPQVTWFWQSPAVTLLLPSSARRRTEAGGGGARSTLSAQQRSKMAASRGSLYHHLYFNGQQKGQRACEAKQHWHVRMRSSFFLEQEESVVKGRRHLP